MFALLVILSSIVKLAFGLTRCPDYSYLSHIYHHKWESYNERCYYFGDKYFMDYSESEQYSYSEAEKSCNARHLQHDLLKSIANETNLKELLCFDVHIK